MPSATAMPATARMRAYRDRLRRGACVLRNITVDDEVGLIELLIDSRLLSEAARDDRLAVARATGRLLNGIVAEHFRKDMP